MLIAGLFFSAAEASNTVTTNQGIVNLVLDSDWTWTTTFPERPTGLEVIYIIFHPGAASDVLAIKSDNDNGPYYFPPLAVSSGEDSRIIYGFGNRMRIHIDYGASTLSAGHYVIIYFK